MNKIFMTAALALVLAAVAAAQDSPGQNSPGQNSPGMKAPSVTLAPPPTITITRGKSATVPLEFRVGNGSHQFEHSSPSS
jgi:hypothetical protein